MGSTLNLSSFHHYTPIIYAIDVTRNQDYSSGTSRPRMMTYVDYLKEMNMKDTEGLLRANSFLIPRLYRANNGQFYLLYPYGADLANNGSSSSGAEGKYNIKDDDQIDVEYYKGRKTTASPDGDVITYSSFGVFYFFTFYEENNRSFDSTLTIYSFSSFNLALKSQLQAGLIEKNVYVHDHIPPIVVEYSHNITDINKDLIHAFALYQVIPSDSRNSGFLLPINDTVYTSCVSRNRYYLNNTEAVNNFPLSYYDGNNFLFIALPLVPKQQDNVKTTGVDYGNIRDDNSKKYASAPFLYEAHELVKNGNNVINSYPTSVYGKNAYVNIYTQGGGTSIEYCAHVYSAHAELVEGEVILSNVKLYQPQYMNLNGSNVCSGFTSSHRPRYNRTTEYTHYNPVNDISSTVNDSFLGVPAQVSPSSNFLIYSMINTEFSFE